MTFTMLQKKCLEILSNSDLKENVLFDYAPPEGINVSHAHEKPVRRSFDVAQELQALPTILYQIVLGEMTAKNRLNILLSNLSKKDKEDSEFLEALESLANSETPLYITSTFEKAVVNLLLSSSTSNENNDAQNDEENQDTFISFLENFLDNQMDIRFFYNFFNSKEISDKYPESLNFLIAVSKHAAAIYDLATQSLKNIQDNDAENEMTRNAKLAGIKKSLIIAKDSGHPEAQGGLLQVERLLNNYHMEIAENYYNEARKTLLQFSSTTLGSNDNNQKNLQYIKESYNAALENLNAIDKNYCDSSLHEDIKLLTEKIKKLQAIIKIAKEQDIFNSDSNLIALDTPEQINHAIKEIERSLKSLREITGFNQNLSASITTGALENVFLNRRKNLELKLENLKKSTSNSPKKDKGLLNQAQELYDTARAILLNLSIESHDLSSIESNRSKALEKLNKYEEASSSKKSPEDVNNKSTQEINSFKEKLKAIEEILSLINTSKIFTLNYQPPKEDPSAIQETRHQINKIIILLEENIEYNDGEDETRPFKKLLKTRRNLLKPANEKEELSAPELSVFFPKQKKNPTSEIASFTASFSLPTQTTAMPVSPTELQQIQQLLKNSVNKHGLITRSHSSRDDLTQGVTLKNQKLNQQTPRRYSVYGGLKPNNFSGITLQPLPRKRAQSSNIPSLAQELNIEKIAVENSNPSQAGLNPSIPKNPNHVDLLKNSEEKEGSFISNKNEITQSKVEKQLNTAKNPSISIEEKNLKTFEEEFPKLKLAENLAEQSKEEENPPPFQSPIQELIADTKKQENANAPLSSSSTHANFSKLTADSAQPSTEEKSFPLIQPPTQDLIADTKEQTNAERVDVSASTDTFSTLPKINVPNKSAKADPFAQAFKDAENTAKLNQQKEFDLLKSSAIQQDTPQTQVLHSVSVSTMQKTSAKKFKLIRLEEDNNSFLWPLLKIIAGICLVTAGILLKFLAPLTLAASLAVSIPVMFLGLVLIGSGIENLADPRHPVDHALFPHKEIPQTTSSMQNTSDKNNYDHTQDNSRYQSIYADAAPTTNSQSSLVETSSSGNENQSSIYPQLK